MYSLRESKATDISTGALAVQVLNGRNVDRSGPVFEAVVPRQQTY